MRECPYYSADNMDKIGVKTDTELIRSNGYIYQIWMKALITATVILNALSTMNTNGRYVKTLKWYKKVDAGNDECGNCKLNTGEYTDRIFSR